ncbi:MAG: lipopolysaccharide biosynthesis protein [Chloroflexi bacterium]|nr:MAG: lipopolysaccharide biosynthesis protein [Chloroflexota bacterium]
MVLSLAVARSAVPLGLFVASVAVGRALHADGLGRYAALTAIAQLVVWGLGAGFPLMAIRDISAGRSSTHYVGRVMTTFFAISLPGVLAMSVAYAIFSRSLIGFEQAVLAGLSSCLFNAMFIVSAANSGRQAFRASAAGEVVGGVLLGVLSVVAVTLGGGIREVLLASCVAWGLATTVLLRLQAPAFTDVPPESHIDLARRQVPYLLYGVVNGSYSRIDAAILRIVAGPAATGVYAAAYRLLGPYFLVGSAFAYVFLGRAPHYGPPWTDQWVRTIRRAQLSIGASLTAGALIGILLAPLMITLIFGGDYDMGGVVARVILLAVIPYSFYWPLVLGLNMADERRELLWVFALPTLIDSILVAVLGWQLGPIGAAVAWVSSEALLLLIVEQRFGRLCRIRRIALNPSGDRVHSLAERGAD